MSSYCGLLKTFSCGPVFPWRIALCSYQRLHLIIPISSLSSSGNKSKTYYDILSVPRYASRHDIKAAYVKLSKQYHPDLNPNNPTAKELFVEINEAYSTLIEPSSRYQYDLKLHTITAHQFSMTNRSYAGSRQYTRTRQSSFHDNINYSYYYNQSNAFTGEQYSHSNTHKRVSHGRIIIYLVLMMLLATGVHSYRIHWAHRDFQRHSEEESMRNQAIYSEVRERAKNSSVQQQLAILSSRYAETTSKK